MTALVRYGKSACLGLLWLATMGWFVGSMTACTTTVTTNGVKSDMVTDSDEPDARKRARIRLELALGYFNNGQTAVALDEVKQSIATDPSLFEAHNLRGLIYMRLNDVALAEESFKRALSLNPKASTIEQNYGWLLCQQPSRLTESYQHFSNALANPVYGDRAKTWLTLGLCQQKGGLRAEAEASLLRAYELDAGNPHTGFNLATLALQRRDYVRAQFYVRRINNSELATADSLWLGIKIERQLGNRDGMAQLGGQLKKRFPQSLELSAYERSAFDE